MGGKDKRASRKGAVVSKDEFAEYGHDANERHGDDECRDANESRIAGECRDANEGGIAGERCGANEGGPVDGERDGRRAARGGKGSHGGCEIDKNDAAHKKGATNDGSAVHRGVADGDAVDVAAGNAADVAARATVDVAVAAAGATVDAAAAAVVTDADVAAGDTADIAVDAAAASATVDAAAAADAVDVAAAGTSTDADAAAAAVATTDATADDAKARRRAHRAAVRAQLRQQGAFGQQGSAWGGLPYSDALLQEGLEHARIIAEKRINGTPRTAEDWLDNNAEVNLALLAKAGRLARECLIEAHLDAVYAATKGYKRLFEAHDLGAEYHRAVRLAVEDSIDKFNLSEGHVLNSWVSTNKKPVERRLCECYAQKTALRSEHEARKYFTIIKAYRKLEDSLQGARRPTEDELLEALAEYTATRGLGREAMLDILDRGSDGVHRVVFSAASPRDREAASASACASVVPVAKLAAGAADVVSVVDTIHGAEDAGAEAVAEAGCTARTENTAEENRVALSAGGVGATRVANVAEKQCAVRIESAAGSASSAGDSVVHDSDALIFRNGVEQDMTPVERAVYRARIAPIIDAGARLQTLAKTAEGIRISCGLPMMQADRVRRIELRLRERFVLGGELGVYSGAETSTWLRQERSRLHSDYWLLDLLALRLAEMLPKQSAAPKAKAKVKAAPTDAFSPSPSARAMGVSRDDCYSMLLPMAVKTDDLSGKNGNGYAKALWENKKLSEDAAEKEGCLQAYKEYLENPLAVVRGKMLARVPEEVFPEEDSWRVLLWHFFFDEATDTEIEEFVAALKDALIHDAAVTGSSEYVVSTARAYVVKRLLASAAARGDGWDRALEHMLGLMLCWMFDVECADDESVAFANDGLLTGGGVASARKKSKAGRVLSFDAYIVDGPAHIDLEEGRELRVHPWLRPRVGIGHAFEKDECRQLGCRRAEFSGEKAWGVLNLPGQQECLALGANGRAQDPVSREHAFLLYAGSDSQRKEKGWLAFDLASTNGTLIARSNADGSMSNVIVGFGANNYADARALSFGAACAGDEQLLREAARRAGAAVQMHGACIMPGDTLVFGFAVVEDANGVVSFGARNGALCLRVREA